jgi:hypothetical protein
MTNARFGERLLATSLFGLAADCPYLVNSHDEIGARLDRFAEIGVTTIILDALANTQDLKHLRRALASGGIVLMGFDCAKQSNSINTTCYCDRFRSIILA